MWLGTTAMETPQRGVVLLTFASRTRLRLEAMAGIKCNTGEKSAYITVDGV